MIWRFGAGLFLIVNVQILDDGAVLAIGATPKAAAIAAGAVVRLIIFAGIAQSAEHRSRNAEAGCSNHPASTNTPS